MNDGGRCDALVAGGGLAGGLAALALARLGLSIAMVEAREPAPSTDTAENRDGRSISLSLASLRVLDALGIADSVAEVSQPITTVHISEAGHCGHLRFTAEEMGVPALGRVVPADPLLATIMEAAKTAGVKRICPATAETATLDDDRASRTVTLTGSDGPVTVKTRLLVVADGAGSALRDALGIRHQVQPYNNTALVTTARVSTPHPGIAFERFTSEGTLAVLPRSGDRVGVVWSVKDERADAFTSLSPEAFLARVATALGGRLGAMQALAPVRHFPLKGDLAKAQIAERAVVIGNAAHSLHPVAAQGFNLSVRDIAVLAECLEDRGDPGGADALQDYAARRRRDQARTRGYTGLARILGDLETPFAAPARALGLMAAEFNRPLARALARQGMGLSPRPLPELVRGKRL